MITCDEIIEETKNTLRNFTKRKVGCKARNFYILLALLFIIKTLSIVVSIYCCFMKYCGKRIITISRHKKQFYRIFILITDIKNRTYYYFDDIIKIQDFDFDNNL